MYKFCVLSTTTARNVKNGNGSTTVFPLDFAFFDATSLVVTLVSAAGVETVKTLTTDYTVSGGAGATGTVTTTSFTPATGEQLVIERLEPATQGTDFKNFDDFAAETVESRMDRMVMATQRALDLNDRAVKFPIDESPTAAQQSLPDAASRVSKFLGFDASGDMIAAAGTSADLTPVSAFINTLLDDADAATARATLDTFEDVFTTRGDLLRAGASGVEERLALGGARKLLESDGTDVVWSELALPVILTGRIAGFVPSNNGVDAAHDLDVTAGVAVADDDSTMIRLASALTKQLDVTWAVGDDAGGFASGESLPTSGTIHVWVIRRSDTGVVDIMANNHATSALSPTLPTNYDAKVRVCSLTTDGSANLRAFTAVETAGGGLRFNYGTKVTDRTSTATGATAVTLTVPIGIQVRPRNGLNMVGDGTGTDVSVLTGDGGGTADIYAGYKSIATEQPQSQTDGLHLTNTAGQIQWDLAGAALTSLDFDTFGYWDERR